MLQLFCQACLLYLLWNLQGEAGDTGQGGECGSGAVFQSYATWQER